jgi:RimJ/RimL family protein N-acetyltransferase
MNIINDNLIIRNATQNDAYILASWWNDGEVMAHAGFPNGIGTSKEEVSKKLKLDSDVNERRLIIEYQDIPIGEMVYINKGNHIAEIGIKICQQQYQEKGLGRIVLSMLIKELFDMKYKKIVLDTNLTNTRAQHVYEKIGFHKVRVNYSSWKDQLGNMQSSIDYELEKDTFVDFSINNE